MQDFLAAADDDDNCHLEEAQRSEKKVAVIVNEDWQGGG